MFSHIFIEALTDILEYKVMLKAENERAIFNDDVNSHSLPCLQNFDITFEKVWTSFDLRAYVKVCDADSDFDDSSFYASLKTRVKDAIKIRLQ